MADRIAVLQAWRLELVGGVRELYTDPRSRFVAEFLGRPAINWLPGPAGSVLGLRPEHLRPQPQGRLRARPLRREWWGHQQLLWLESAHGTLRMLLPEEREAAGEGLWLDWRREDELWFAADGRRLPDGGPWRQGGSVEPV